MMKTFKKCSTYQNEGGISDYSLRTGGIPPKKLNIFFVIFDNFWGVIYGLYDFTTWTCDSSFIKDSKVEISPRRADSKRFTIKSFMRIVRKMMKSIPFLTSSIRYPR